jgi:hypothetical protein
VSTLKAWLLKKLLTPAQHAVLIAIEEPARWMPGEDITPGDAQNLGELFRSPLMLKVDVAMINFANQAAQAAIMAPTAEVVSAAGYARGVRAGWQVAKSLSTLTGAEAGATEEGDTDAPVLEHLSP